MNEGIKSYFTPYEGIIDNLTSFFIVTTTDGETEMNISACQLSLDSKYMIMILKCSDEKIKIKALETETFEPVLELEIAGDYVKANNIIQNLDGHVFAVPYLLDG